MIVAEDVTFRYHLQSGNDVPTLNGLSLEIGESENVAVIGPNGSGKSTLARCLNGLIVPQSGRILVDGLDTADPENKWQVHQLAGMIFQNPDNQLVSTTVEREVAFGSRTSACLHRRFTNGSRGPSTGFTCRSTAITLPTGCPAVKSRDWPSLP